MTQVDTCAHRELLSHRYTGKEGDSESGNDYFGARYYASSMGRFMSPDWDSKPQAVPYANLADPQSLNLYSYVLNNPLSKTDPNGHDWFNVDGKWHWQQGHVYHDADGNATKGVTAWHEFGHAWGYIHGRVGEPSYSEARAWENRMRQQVYGPLGPHNGPRVRE
jgi:RHS repeat-associated protein